MPQVTADAADPAAQAAFWGLALGSVPDDAPIGAWDVLNRREATSSASRAGDRRDR